MDIAVSEDAKRAHEDSERDDLERLVDIVGFCARTARHLRERLKSGEEPDCLDNIYEATALEMVLHEVREIVETNSFIVKEAALKR